MADFDPAAYLARKRAAAAPTPAATPAGGFDPKAYLAKKRGVSADAFPEVIEEMHPAFSTGDRLAVKWLANDPKASAAYLQREHPELEVRTDEGSDKIMARAKGESAYRVLDPDTGIVSSDILRDLGDLGFDALSAVGSTAATAAGGVVGGLPGAIGAGAASGAGIETARQALGKLVGVNQEMDEGGVAVAGGLGGLAPALFGTGATAGQLVSKSLNPFKQAAQGPVPQVVSQAQRGGLERLYDLTTDKVTPILGEYVSGATRNSIRTLKDRLPEVQRLEKTGVKDLTTNIAEGISEKIRKVEDISYNRFLSAIKDVPDQVDLQAASTPFRDLLVKATRDSGDLGNSASAAFVDEITEHLSDLFAKASTRPEAAITLQRQLGEMAEFARLQPGSTKLTNRFGPQASHFDKELARAAEKSYRIIKDQVEKIAEKHGGGGAKKAYVDALHTRQTLSKYFKDSQTTYNNLSNLDRKSKRMLMETLTEADETYGLGIAPDAQLLETVSIFGKPSLTPLSSMGTTSTSRSAPLAGAMGTAGYLAGAQSGLGQGGAGLGAGLGTMIGNFLGAPAAIRKATEGARALGRKTDRARNSGVRPNQVIPSWMLMETNDSRVDGQ